MVHRSGVVLVRNRMAYLLEFDGQVASWRIMAGSRLNPQKRLGILSQNYHLGDNDMGYQFIRVRG